MHGCSRTAKRPGDQQDAGTPSSHQRPRDWGGHRVRRPRIHRRVRSDLPEPPEVAGSESVSNTIPPAYFKDISLDDYLITSGRWRGHKVAFRAWRGSEITAVAPSLSRSV